MAGRPTSLTPETRRIILEALKAGVFISTACQIAGITEKTFYNWVRRGQSEDPSDIEFSRFLQSCSKIIAATEISAVASIRAAGKKNWKAFAWWLSRRHGKRWGAHQEAGGQVQGRPPVPLTVKTTKRDKKEV